MQRQALELTRSQIHDVTPGDLLAKLDGMFASAVSQGDRRQPPYRRLHGPRHGLQASVLVAGDRAYLVHTGIRPLQMSQEPRPGKPPQHSWRIRQPSPWWTYGNQIGCRKAEERSVATKYSQPLSLSALMISCLFGSFLRLINEKWGAPSAVYFPMTIRVYSGSKLGASPNVFFRARGWQIYVDTDALAHDRGRALQIRPASPAVPCHRHSFYSWQ